MLLFVGGPDVSRTPEARVLETAREMLGSGWRGWLIPHINGQVRLEKPPIAYWMAAVSFKIFGVGPGAGRIPFAILGWLAIGLVYRIGAELFDRTTALATSAALLGSYLFFRHMRLAETDGPAALFVTAAIWWMWRGLNRRRWADLQLSAIATGLALMTKQGTVAYPLIFLVVWIVIERRWADAWRWIASGAPLTILIVGAPWWIFVLHKFGWHVAFKESSDLATGRDHFAWPVVYIPWLLVAVAPWVALIVLALVASIRRWKINTSLRMILIWCIAILLPLCCIGNKQPHYLLPLMIPLMLPVGWLVREMLNRRLEEGEASWFRILLLATLLAGPVAAGSIFFVTSHMRGVVTLQDVVVAGLLTIFCLWGLAVFARNAPAAALLIFFAAAFMMPYAIGRWIPSLQPHTHGHAAARIVKKFGYESMCFYGKEESISMAFALRRIIPQYQTPTDLTDALARHPHLLVLVKNQSPPIPSALQKVFEDKIEDQTIRVYARK